MSWSSIRCVTGVIPCGSTKVDTNLFRHTAERNFSLAALHSQSQKRRISFSPTRSFQKLYLHELLIQFSLTARTCTCFVSFFFIYLFYKLFLHLASGLLESSLLFAPRLAQKKKIFAWNWKNPHPKLFFGLLFLKFLARSVIARFARGKTLTPSTEFVERVSHAIDRNQFGLIKLLRLLHFYLSFCLLYASTDLKCMLRARLLAIDWALRFILERKLLSTRISLR